jgi:glycosyltransferase involved in cell wall biosynthesis
MLEEPTVPGVTTTLTIVIVAYNDWASLRYCLSSLQEQTNAAPFEVVVIDDGSDEPAPEFIRQYSDRLPLRILREPHRGIAASRNCGVLASRGDVVVFADADCKLKEDCLAMLMVALNGLPEVDYFQLHLFGDHSNLVGRAEELRLRAIQRFGLRPDGRIRYLNTAGFAIRKRRIKPGQGIFDPESMRAEDTLLLCDLMDSGELPLFVPEAAVTHAIPLNVIECFQKDVRSAPLEARSFRIMAARGSHVRMSNQERWSMLKNMWRDADDSSLGKAAWFVVVARQGLQRLLSSAYSVISPPARDDNKSLM